jgi:DNA-binding HxlR family transcriptional regulator
LQEIILGLAAIDLNMSRKALSRLMFIYGEIKRLIPGISEKMLIQELKSLVEYGVLEKKAYAKIPPRVEYQLTAKGRKVLPLIEEMRILGREFVEREQ